ncbi:MAG: hypothetical protein WCA37_02950 [Terracidiphilus sp.]
MGEHRPKPPQCLRRHTGPELRDVTLQISADEVLAPFHAGSVAPSEKTGRKAPAHPQAIDLGSLHFESIERRELKVGDAARQTFSGLLEKIHRCGSEQEEPAGAFASPSTAINQAAKTLEQLRRPVYFVEDDQLILVFREVALRIRELRPVGNGLKVQVEGWARVSHFESEGGFSNLAWAEESHSRVAADRRQEILVVPSSNYPCNYGIYLRKCKDQLSRSMEL